MRPCRTRSQRSHRLQLTSERSQSHRVFLEQTCDSSNLATSSPDSGRMWDVLYNPETDRLPVAGSIFDWPVRTKPLARRTLRESRAPVKPFQNVTEASNVEPFEM